MRCEVVAVGTELLLGQIVDTNSAWIGERLALAGIDSHYQSKVGDNRARMIECIRLALQRSDAVIVCGGLGPTQDDITREAIAEIMGVELVRDETIAEHIRQLFERRGRVMSANNLNQADVPVGASPIPEMPGTAPGLICPLADKVIYAVPGVPYEMREMLAGTVLPDLQRRSGNPAVIRSRVLRTWGHSESGLAELLAARIEELDRLGNPTLAFQASGIDGLKVRITAKMPDEDLALAVLDDEEARLRRILGDLVFGLDEETMESVVLDMVRRAGASLAAVETVTGGLLANRLHDWPAARQVLRGVQVMAHSGEAARQLGIGAAPGDPAALVEALAAGAAAHFGAEIGLAAIGDRDPALPLDAGPGDVWLGLAIRDATQSQLARLPGDRRRLRQFTVISLLDFARKRLALAALAA